MLATEIPDALVPVAVAALGAAGGLAGIIITSRAGRLPAADTASGALATGAAELTSAALELVEATADAGRRLADALEAERDACNDDRLVLLELAEEAGLEPATIHRIRQRVATRTT